jgi:hypothetical protein
MTDAFTPITTRAQLDALDQDSILEGYRAGMGFIPVNHTKTDRGYWHGFNNGQIDRGLVPSGPENAALARECIDEFRAIFAEKH